MAYKYGFDYVKIRGDKSNVIYTNNLDQRSDPLQFGKKAHVNDLPTRRQIPRDVLKRRPRLPPPFMHKLPRRRRLDQGHRLTIPLFHPHHHRIIRLLIPAHPPSLLQRHRPRLNKRRLRPPLIQIHRARSRRYQGPTTSLNHRCRQTVQTRRHHREDGDGR